MEIQYSQLKINHLNHTPSTKAAGGGIYSGVLLKDVKVPVKVRRTLSSVGTSFSNSFIGAIIDKDTSDTLEYCQLIKIPKYWDIWTCSFANELKWLFQGIHEHKGTDTYFFIKKLDVPKGRTYTYFTFDPNWHPSPWISRISCSSQ
jgi:hypothetical protein